MDNSARDNRDKSFRTMRMIYDITMGLLMGSLGSAMIMAERLGFVQVLDWGVAMRYSFGAIFLLYGVFRIYRGIKQTA
jgi:hypothetical protein